MLLNRARGDHPLHDRFYEGGYPQIFDTRRGRIVREIPIFDLAKQQFEPILENELKPLSMAECELRNHIKKHTSKSFS